MRFLFLLLFVFPTVLLHAQSNGSTVKVYWDVSLSMEQRDLAKEILFLKEYVKKNNVKSIVLIEFANGINSAKEFSLVDASLSNLTKYLSEITYDGISNMDFLLKEYSDLSSLLFTDGYPRLKELKLHYGKSKMDVICATGNCNPILEKLSLYSIGTYHGLLPQNENSVRTRNKLRGGLEHIVVNGVVNDSKGPVEDVAIIIKGTNQGTLTTTDGSFAIKVIKGDSVVFQFLGKRTMTLPVDTTSRFFQVTLEDAVENLDEVVLVQKEKIKWLPKEKVLGYGGMQTIDKKDLTVSSGSLNESLAGKVSGVQTNKDGFGRAIIRGFSSIEQSNYPLVIIDGAPMPRAEFNGPRNVNADILNMVNPNDVISVKVLKGLAATNFYGGEGANGVILVKTRYGDVKLSEKSDVKANNSALIRNNNYTGVLKVGPQDVDKSYLKGISSQSNTSDSYAVYLQERGTYINDPYYFINIHNLFQESDPVLGERILSSALAVSGNSIPALRSIAFYHQKAARYTQAVAIYEQIVNLDSSRVQAYRDLANVHIQAGNNKEGLKRYLELVQPDFKPELAPKSMKDIATLELKNLIYRKGKEMDVSRVPSSYKSAPRYDARVILEWNNPESEFEVEFISPFKKISKWSHTNKNNQERLQNELRYGFHIEESLLSQVQKGDWYLNVRTINHKENAPLFLKCTVYYYYGQAGQYATQEVFTFDSGSNERIITKISIK